MLCVSVVFDVDEMKSKLALSPSSLLAGANLNP
jgi:hypothetical protein